MAALRMTLKISRHDKRGNRSPLADLRLEREYLRRCKVTTITSNCLVFTQNNGTVLRSVFLLRCQRIHHETTSPPSYLLVLEILVLKEERTTFEISTKILTTLSLRETSREVLDDTY